LLQILWRGRPVPLSVIVFARRFFRAPDALAPTNAAVASTGRALADPRLAVALEHEQLGEWSLTAPTLDFIAAHLRRVAPERVLELGSGLSTACIAHVLRETRGAAPARLVSVDESSEFQADAERLLGLLDVRDAVELHVCPLRPQRLGGENVSTYGFGESLFASLRANPPDLVVIDGPSGGGLSRYAALRILAPHLRAGTIVLLDDALRDDELVAGRRWRNERLVEVEGVALVGKGLLVGRLAESDGTRHE
jgi:predicted O-methyltransferase YrrM